MKTIYKHASKQGVDRDISAASAEDLLRDYPLAWNQTANDYNGGRGYSIGPDMLGGAIVRVVSAALDGNGWLSAFCGTHATARQVMKAWSAVRAPEQMAGDSV